MKKENYTIVNGELYHYGVPGMRWGHRKRVPSADSSEVKKIRKKSIDEMSNQELQKANNRLDLERRYKENTKKTNHAKKIINGFVSASKTISAVTAAAVIYKKVGKKAVDKIGNAIFKDIAKGIKGPLH